MDCLALDIGGANIKSADGKEYASSVGFSMWQRPQQLAQQLLTMIAEAPPSERLAVTMTGELSACFADVKEGVQSVLSACESAAAGRHLRVYLSSGDLVSLPVALTRPLEVNSANWHALAQFACRQVETWPALLIDVGSSTCDITPLVDGLPQTKGRNDRERLMHGELVYSGIQHSPLCALRSTVTYRDSELPVAQEVFATTTDIYVLIGALREDSGNTSTADGRPATRHHARQRLGRLICASGDEFEEEDALIMAKAFARAQQDLLQAALEKVIDQMAEPPQHIVLSGHGEFLSRQCLRSLALTAPRLSFAELLGANISRCATAHALAALANESG